MTPCDTTHCGREKWITFFQNILFNLYKFSNSSPFCIIQYKIANHEDRVSRFLSVQNIFIQEFIYHILYISCLTPSSELITAETHLHLRKIASRNYLLPRKFYFLESCMNNTSCPETLLVSLYLCKCCAGSLLRRDSGPVEGVVEPQLWWWQDQQFTSHPSTSRI